MNKIAYSDMDLGMQKVNECFLLYGIENIDTLRSNTGGEKECTFKKDEYYTLKTKLRQLDKSEKSDAKFKTPFSISSCGKNGLKFVCTKFVYEIDSELKSLN